MLMNSFGSNPKMKIHDTSSRADGAHYKGLRIKILQKSRIVALKDGAWSFRFVVLHRFVILRSFCFRCIAVRCSARAEHARMTRVCSYVVVVNVGAGADDESVLVRCCSQLRSCYKDECVPHS